jgi:hypothetical protein
VFFAPLIAFLALLLPAPAGAQGPEWSFDAGSTSSVEIPEWLPADSLRAALDYEATDAIRGLVVDLNRDGIDDYVFQFSQNVCGTNCQYQLIDGRTRRSLGLVGGSVVYVRATLVNAYPVINQYGHSSAESGYWSTLVFDGREYVAVSTVWLSGEALERLFRELQGIAHGPTSGNRP